MVIHAAPPPAGRHDAERRADGGHRDSAAAGGADGHQRVDGGRRRVLHRLAPQERQAQARRGVGVHPLHDVRRGAGASRPRSTSRRGYARFVRNPHWLEQFGYKEYFDEIDPQHLKAYDEALKYGSPEPFAPNYVAMGDEMSQRHRARCSATRRPTAARSSTRSRRWSTPTSTSSTPRTRCASSGASSGRSSRSWRSSSSWAACIYCSPALSANDRQEQERHVRDAARPPRGSTSTRGYSSSPRWRRSSLWSYVPLLRGSLMAFYDYKIFGDEHVHRLRQLHRGLEAARLLAVAQEHVLLLGAHDDASVSSRPSPWRCFLSEVPRLKITFRVLFYLPALTSGLVLMFLWKDLFFDASRRRPPQPHRGAFGHPAADVAAGPEARDVLHRAARHLGRRGPGKHHLSRRPQDRARRDVRGRRDGRRQRVPEDIPGDALPTSSPSSSSTSSARSSARSRPRRTFSS